MDKLDGLRAARARFAEVVGLLDAEIDEEVAKTEPPAHPVPKHLDFGMYCIGKSPPVGAIYIHTGVSADRAILLKPHEDHGTWCANALDRGYFTHIFGNLGALAEKVEEFEIEKDCGHYASVIERQGDFIVMISLGGQKWKIRINEAIPFALKLIAMAITAEGKCGQEKA